MLITDRIDELDRLDLSEIIPERLWVGAAPSKSDLIELKRQYGTELVIMDLVGIADENAWCQELGISYDERTPKLEENRESIPLSRLKVASGVIRSEERRVGKEGRLQ